MEGLVFSGFIETRAHQPPPGRVHSTKAGVSACWRVGVGAFCECVGVLNYFGVFDVSKMLT